jgi:hypothetical protein
MVVMCLLIAAPVASAQRGIPTVPGGGTGRGPIVGPGLGTSLPPPGTGTSPGGTLARDLAPSTGVLTGSPGAPTAGRGTGYSGTDSSGGSSTGTGRKPRRTKQQRAMLDKIDGALRSRLGGVTYQKQRR